MVTVGGGVVLPVTRMSTQPAPGAAFDPCLFSFSPALTSVSPVSVGLIFIPRPTYLYETCRAPSRELFFVSAAAAFMPVPRGYYENDFKKKRGKKKREEMKSSLTLEDWRACTCQKGNHIK